MSRSDPVRLRDVASYVKSTNAGASMLTFDIGFPDKAVFDEAVRDGWINREAIHRLYEIPLDAIEIYAYAPAQIIKVTVPRSTRSGGPDERDFDGVQQFAPLLDLMV